MKKAIQYGAGNIGRGFIGQLLSQSGYEVVFIDVNKEVVTQLNADRQYPVKIVAESGMKEVWVKNVRAVDGMDAGGVAGEISSCDIMATAVGVNVLPWIVPNIVAGLRQRWNEKNFKPLNIIICENLLDANRYLEKLIKEKLSTDEKELFDKYVGLVEASIGRMVPVMTPEMQEGNKLKVWVEEFCELPVDKEAFKGGIPEILNLIPFSPFEFYLQRKLFIHNMGHAITAYLGYMKGYKYIWEAIADKEIRSIATEAMWESASAVAKEHNMELDILERHVDDLINRFGNRYLGDTVERVGKDPIRKLSSNDRLAGALKLCLKHGIEPSHISAGLAAALCFNPETDSAATKVQSMLEEGGCGKVLEDLCELKGEAVNKIVELHDRLSKKKDISAILT